MWVTSKTLERTPREGKRDAQELGEVTCGMRVERRWGTRQTRSWGEKNQL